MTKRTRQIIIKVFAITTIIFMIAGSVISAWLGVSY